MDSERGAFARVALLARPGAAQQGDAEATTPHLDDDWRYRGSCSTEDPELFFPDVTRRSVRVVQEEHARRICAGCPVLEQCRTYALTHRERYGVWGGTTAREREAIGFGRRDRVSA